FSERFRDDVIDDFIAEYRAGRTPNPCMRCNEKIKFQALLERAIELGFDAICTGHYATLVEGEGGLELHRSSEEAKDQSYVLGCSRPSSCGTRCSPSARRRRSRSCVPKRPSAASRWRRSPTAMTSASS